MRYYEIMYIAVTWFFGLLFYFMLMGMDNHLYELEDRLQNMCVLEMAG